VNGRRRAVLDVVVALLLVPTYFLFCLILSWLVPEVLTP
jgi:hypothetical protein